MGINKGKKLIIIGAGGFGREVKWLTERINQRCLEKTGQKKWELVGFLDDGIPAGTNIQGIPVLGGLQWLEQQKEKLNLVCAVGSANTRERIINCIRSLKNSQNFCFPAMCDPTAVFASDLRLEQGCIICAGTVLTVNVQMEEFCIVNLSCTIGHDVSLKPFVTVYPGVNVSGCVQVGKGSELGTGSCVIQGIQIEKNVIVGAGAVVIRDLPEGCTAVGSPALPVKYRQKSMVRRGQD